MNVKLLDALVILVIVIMFFTVVLPLLQDLVRWLFKTKSSAIGDLKDTEDEVEQALETKRTAEEVIARAKERAEATVEKANEIKKKI